MPECMDEMVPLECEFSVFHRLGLAKPPVGVKFLFAKLVDNLATMKYVLPSYEDGRDNYSKRFDRVTGANE